MLNKIDDYFTLTTCLIAVSYLCLMASMAQ